MDLSVIPQGKAERAAFVQKLFAGMKPAQTKQSSLLQQLKPLRHDLLLKQKEGYNLRQIAESLKQKPLEVNISASTVRDLLGGSSAKRKATLKKKAAQRAAAKAAATANAAGVQTPGAQTVTR